ncbi:MAG: hypothetical protein M1541_18070 [Acidobacteria bacterium]|nr:hypothetical protein [Acidobacteriota bacterium]
MKKIRIATMVCIVLVFAAIPALAATHYFQGFETDTVDWTGASRVASGTISSAAGSFHGEVENGAFTRFGGFENTFPAGGYTTSIDIYLAVNADFPNDMRFDYSSAISQPDGNHRRDFMFNGGYYNDTDATGTGPRFVVSASNNSPGWPKNPGRNPVAITETGWYTFIHKFSNNGGVLKVDLSITKLDGTPVTGANWTLSDSTDIIGSTVGGHRYGWFVGQSQLMPVSAIDNVSLLSVSEAATVSACKNGGWQGLVRADGSPFLNQGDCIQYVNTGK